MLDVYVHITELQDSGIAGSVENTGAQYILEWDAASNHKIHA